MQKLNSTLIFISFFILAAICLINQSAPVLNEQSIPVQPEGLQPLVTKMLSASSCDENKQTTNKFFLVLVSAVLCG